MIYNRSKIIELSQVVARLESTNHILNLIRDLKKTPNCFKRLKIEIDDLYLFNVSTDEAYLGDLFRQVLEGVFSSTKQ